MKLLETISRALDDEKALAKTVAAVCTPLTLFNVLFMDNEMFFDGLMLLFNGVIIACVLEMED